MDKNIRTLVEKLSTLNYHNFIKRNRIRIQFVFFQSAKPSLWQLYVRLLKDIFMLCNKWESKSTFVLKNRQNSNVSEDIRKFSKSTTNLNIEVSY